MSTEPTSEVAVARAIEENAIQAMIDDPSLTFSTKGSCLPAAESIIRLLKLSEAGEIRVNPVSFNPFKDLLGALFPPSWNWDCEYTLILPMRGAPLRTHKGTPPGMVQIVGRNGKVISYFLLPTPNHA